MTRDELIRIAVHCCLVHSGNRDGIYMDALEDFANLVAAAEREAIEQSVLDVAMQYVDPVWVRDILKAISARGSHE